MFAPLVSVRMKRVSIRNARFRRVVARMTAPMPEPELQRRFTELLEPGQVLFDVGANMGLFSILGATLVGGKGSVYAFDPVPHHADPSASPHPCGHEVETAAPYAVYTEAQPRGASSSS
jgi:hypothetical protein